MKTKICTSLEQSKRLLKLGIDVNTADMYYQYYKSYSPSNGITKGHCDIPVIGSWKEHHISIPDPAMSHADIPAWSLSALLGLMPKSICIKQSEHSGYFYFLEWQFANDNSLRYVGNDRKCLIDIYSDHDDGWKDSIDTAFEMICWLLESHYI